MGWPDFSAQIQLNIRCAADMIRHSRHAVVLSGAGISTPSGIPDFRSANSGLWEKFDPFEVASLSAFRYNPITVFTWMHSLAHAIVNASPNPAHLGLARLQQAGHLQTIITQNIDGLHQRAGSSNVIELHGSWETCTCIGCYRQYISADYLKEYYQSGAIPHCPRCNNILKPDVVLFGEQLPVRPWLQAKEALKSCDLIIVVGSSLEVLPVAGLPMSAVENGSHLVIINQGKTYLDLRADLLFSEDAAVLIPALLTEVLGE